MSQASISHRHCLVFARPRGRSEAEEPKVRLGVRGELEVPACADRDRRSGRDPLCSLGLAIRRPNPYLPGSGEEVPDLLHSPVTHRPAHHARREHSLDQARVPGIEDAEIDVRAVGGDGVRHECRELVGGAAGERQRVGRHATNLELEMEVRSDRKPGAAHKTDLVPLLHRLA
jgi:hypothetical protein